MVLVVAFVALIEQLMLVFVIQLVRYVSFFAIQIHGYDRDYQRCQLEPVIEIKEKFY